MKDSTYLVGSNDGSNLIITTEKQLKNFTKEVKTKMDTKTENKYFGDKENTYNNVKSDCTERKYLHEIGEITDRLSILQIKELLLKENRQQFADEIQLILHDLDLMLKEKGINISAETIRAIIVLAQANLHIWHSESAARKGDLNSSSNNLIFTHQENGVRVRTRNRIQKAFGGREDPKSDCLAAEFNHMEPSWDGK